MNGSPLRCVLSSCNLVIWESGTRVSLLLEDNVSVLVGTNFVSIVFGAIIEAIIVSLRFTEDESIFTINEYIVQYKYTIKKKDFDERIAT